MNPATDLPRVLAILLAAEPTVWRRRVVQGDVAELGDWIRRNGRMPSFSWTGSKTENALAMRLHAYRIHLAHADGVASPESPLVATRSDSSTPRHLRPSPARIVERRRTDEARRRLAEEDVDQSHWPDGAA